MPKLNSRPDGRLIATALAMTVLLLTAPAAAHRESGAPSAAHRESGAPTAARRESGEHGIATAIGLETPRCEFEMIRGTLTARHNDAFGDTTELLQAFVTVQAAGGNVRVPAFGNFEIVEVFGNTTAVVGGSLPVLIGPANSSLSGLPGIDEDGAVTFGVAGYTIQEVDPDPLRVLGSVVWGDRCDEPDTQGCDDEPLVVIVAANTDVYHPRIALTKTADVSMVCEGEPELVTYTYTVTNPGNVELDPVLTDDAPCEAPVFVEGDENGNALLDPGETWTYACMALVSTETTNQAVVTGESDRFDCTASDEASFTIESIACGGDTFCSFTQGYWGNAGGRKFGLGTLELIELLIGDEPLVIGVPGTRSFTIGQDAAECIIDRLPGGGPSRALPADLGDADLDAGDCQTSPVELPVRNGRFRNNLLSQTIALSLNVRIRPDVDPNDPDGPRGPEDFVLMEHFCTSSEDRPESADREPGRIVISIPLNARESIDLTVVNGGIAEVALGNGEGGDPESFWIAADVIDALDALYGSHTVSDLLALANRALAGLSTESATIGQIKDAVDTINNAFDECRTVVACPD